MLAAAFQEEDTARFGLFQKEPKNRIEFGRTSPPLINYDAVSPVVLVTDWYAAATCGGMRLGVRVVKSMNAQLV